VAIANRIPRCLQDRPWILRTAASVADRVVVPVAPTGVDVNRLLDSRIRALTRYEDGFGGRPWYLEEYGKAWEEVVGG
jgi:hypothetical protein